jgi:hypothetical protein
MLLGREVAVHTMHFGATSVIHMFGQLPTGFYVRVYVTHHTGGVGRKVNGCKIQAYHTSGSQKQARQKKE